MSKKDWKAGYRCFTAQGQELAVVHLIFMTQFVVAIGTKEEENLDMLLKKHGYDVVKVEAREKKLWEALKKDQKPWDNRKEFMRYADQIKDKEAFFAEALTWLDKNGSLSRQAEAPTPKQKPQEAGKKDQGPPNLGTVDSGRFLGSNVLRPYYGLKDLRIKGDTASGKLNGQWTVEFRRVNGRWLVDLTNYDSVTGVFLFDYLDDIHGWSY